MAHLKEKYIWIKFLKLRKTDFWVVFLLNDGEASAGICEHSGRPYTGHTAENLEEVS